MSIRLTLKGIEELERKLEREQARLERLAAPHNVSTDELFPSEFMAEHTKLTSFDDMLGELDTKPAVFDDLDAIEEWDRLVAELTDFETWDDMKQTAVELHMARRLGLG